MSHASARHYATYREERSGGWFDVVTRPAGTFARIVRTLCSTLSRNVSITIRSLSHGAIRLS